MSEQFVKRHSVETHSSTAFGRFIGVGVGPGDPELITLKAARFISRAQIIGYLCNHNGESQAKDIVSSIIEEGVNKPKSTLPITELPLYVPMDRDPTVAEKAYSDGAKVIAGHLKQGIDVVFLCEGDPLFFGSFTYLLNILQEHFSCEVVPGISSPHAASSTLMAPLTMLKESYAVVSGRHSERKLKQTLRDFDSIVIMKAGRERSKIVRAIKESERTEDATYLEYIGRANQSVVVDIRNLDEQESGPYFSLFVVTRAKRGRHD